jgi:hypothetical protein
MPISDDWNIDTGSSPPKIEHIDGILSYDAGAGTQPAVGQYIIGATSGAIGKVLARTGDATSGTLTLTNVVGLFVDGETLDILSQVDFDDVSNGGFEIGDTIVDQVSGSVAVKFIEYNIDGTAGHGTIYGNAFTAFTNDSQLDISGGQTDVGAADGTGTDNDTAWDADVDGTLAVPGTTNTNNSIIVHYDAGTIDIPEDAHIQSAVAGAEGYAQRVYGNTLIGSVRVVDSDTTGGSWTNNEALRILDCEYYDTLVAGKVFSVGDIIRGGTSGYEARVLAVIDDGDSTGKLILAGNTGTPWTDTEDIEVRQADDTYVTYANVESGQNSYLDAATLNLPSGVRNEQRADQGGIYAPGSVLIVRSVNAFYTYLVDFFDELTQLDKDPPMDGDVLDQLYTVLSGYVIPDLSFRFLEKGAVKDTGNNNVFINFQTAGVIADIGDHGFFYDSSNPTPQPDIYCEQDGGLRRQDWLEGHVDALVKVKTSTDPKYINPTVNALGQLIDNGTVAFHLRPYRRTYDSAELTVTTAGVAAVFLSNANDGNNTTGQYQAAYQTGVGTPFTVGEEFTTTDGKRGVIVTSDSGATGNITYVLKSATNFVDTDAITGSVSGATAAINGAPTNLVAGYDTNIRVTTVQRRFTGGTTSGGPYVLGEVITQTGTGATGYFMEDDGGSIYIEEQSGVFNGTGLLTGGTSGATNTPTATNAQSTVPKDIGGGVGDKNYTAVTTGNLTGGSAQTVAKIYEWWKFINRKESTYQVNTAGGLFSAYTEGRFFRRYQSTFAEVRGQGVMGTKAGDLVSGCQGMYIERLTLDAADIRSIKLKDNLGDEYDPPNEQTLQMSNLVAGVRTTIFRSTGAGLETILRNEFDVGTVGGGNNQAGDSTVLVGANTRSVSPLPNDVPDSGTIRVLSPNNTGNYIRMTYSSVNRTTNIFTLTGTIGSFLTGEGEASTDLVLDDNVHVELISEEAAGPSVTKNILYVSDIPLFARARIKGKKTFKTTSTFTSTGQNIGAVLNPDNVVNLP